MFDGILTLTTVTSPLWCLLIPAIIAAIRALTTPRDFGLDGIAALLLSVALAPAPLIGHGIAIIPFLPGLLVVIFGWQDAAAVWGLLTVFAIHATAWQALLQLCRLIVGIVRTTSAAVTRAAPTGRSSPQTPRPSRRSPPS